MGFVKIGFIIVAIIVIIIARRYQYLSAEEIIGLVALAIISYVLLFLIGFKIHTKSLKKQMSSNDSKKANDIESKTKEMLATKSLGSDNLPKDKVLIQEASTGSSYHQQELGKMYLDGNGVTKDYSLALYWFTKAAEKNSASAQFYLGVMYSKKQILNDTKKAIEWYEKAAKQDKVPAQLNLSNLYISAKDVVQHKEKSFYWMEKAAEQGNALAQAGLGSKHYRGNGTLKDFSKAFYWFEKAAAQDYPMAFFNLGVMYAEGNGVLKDMQKAKSWTEKAFNNTTDKEASDLAKKSWDRFKLFNY
jgi:TPR repeat protein